MCRTGVHLVHWVQVVGGDEEVETAMVIALALKWLSMTLRGGVLSEFMSLEFSKVWERESG